MLRADEILISLDCEPSQLADPSVRRSIWDMGDQIEEAGLTSQRILYSRNAPVMASLPMLGPYVVPVASIVMSTMSAVLVAWLKTPGRKVKVKFGDTSIEATSVEDVERLLPQIKDLQGRAVRKKPTT